MKSLVSSLNVSSSVRRIPCLYISEFAEVVSVFASVSFYLTRRYEFETLHVSLATNRGPYSLSTVRADDDASSTVVDKLVDKNCMREKGWASM
jgi:hypothetical protein